MQEKGTPAKQSLIESEGISWWSWRPGLKPLHAFLFCGLLSLFALFLLTNGVTALTSGILDSSTPPLQVPGIVTGHSRDVLGSLQLTLRLEQPGFPATITLVVSPATSASLANSAPVIVDYAPHQRIPYALKSAGRDYPLPGASAFGNLLQTITLLLCGLLLLPYPTLLSFWGWRDLHVQAHQRTAIVVALRAARQTTTRTPGLVPRTTHTWYGVALQIENEPETLTEPEILTFGIRQEAHAELRRGDHVQVIYSPYLHYLYSYSLKSSQNTAK